MNKFITILTGFAVMACSSQSSGDNSLLVEANLIHLVSEALQQQVEPKINKLDSLKSLLLAKKTSHADSLALELTALKEDFDNWEKDFFEVPGFAHKSDHEHHHDHRPAQELPADKMLEVQKEIKNNIEQIKTRLERALLQTRKVLK